MRAIATETGKVRKLYHGGEVTHRKEPRPCHMDWHAGPMVEAEKFTSHPDPFWHQFANCGTCGSTITRDQLKTRAA